MGGAYTQRPSHEALLGARGRWATIRLKKGNALVDALTLLGAPVAGYDHGHGGFPVHARGHDHGGAHVQVYVHGHHHVVVRVIKDCR